MVVTPIKEKEGMRVDDVDEYLKNGKSSAFNPFVKQSSLFDDAAPEEERYGVATKEQQRKKQRPIKRKRTAAKNNRYGSESMSKVIRCRSNGESFFPDTRGVEQDHVPAPAVFVSRAAAGVLGLTNGTGQDSDSILDMLTSVLY
jgi:hypothetical protein